MSGPVSMTRRGLLRMAAFAAFGPIATACGRRESEALRIAQLLAAVPAGEEAARVGQIFLLDHPQEADIPGLLRQLPAAGAAVTPEVLAEQLRDRHRADFRAGRTAEIDGFTLSLTELRLFALTHLARVEKSER